ncbi:MAG: 2TM domain-containing protein [Deltaproteobacteria bacterium]
MKESLHDIRARKEYEAIRGFYIHVMVFVPVLLLLFVLDIVGGSGTWVHWVGLGWGLGLAFHAYAAFVMEPRKMARWEQEQIEAIGRRGAAGGPG